jgi:hypothetical protein
MYYHGHLYVNWPKLNTPTFALEGYQSALERAYKDPLIGPFITSTSGRNRRARNMSQQKVGYMEEGKKRLE